MMRMAGVFAEIPDLQNETSYISRLLVFIKTVF
jgi:hypothetical protein